MYVCHAYIMFINHVFEYIICEICMKIMNILLTNVLLTNALLTNVLLIDSLFVKKKQ